jgi:hypothetical protein
MSCIHLDGHEHGHGHGLGQWDSLTTSRGAGQVEKLL